jgi:hypothetical protein
MFKVSLGALFFGIAFGCSCCGLAQDNASSGIPLATVRSNSISTNWEVRMHAAEGLVSDHTHATFRMLLLLLKDKHDDVSYAAAESIEARKDTAFDGELITAIKSLSRDNRWPAYRAAKNYPTPHMLNSLGHCLGEEIQFQRQRTAFDSRNCFYLAQSRGQIAHTLKTDIKPVPPEDADLQAYESFAHSIKHKDG